MQVSLHAFCSYVLDGAFNVEILYMLTVMLSKHTPGGSKMELSATTVFEMNILCKVDWLEWSA